MNRVIDALEKRNEGKYSMADALGKKPEALELFKMFVENQTPAPAVDIVDKLKRGENFNVWQPNEKRAAKELLEEFNRTQEQAEILIKKIEDSRVKGLKRILSSAIPATPEVTEENFNLYLKGIAARNVADLADLSRALKDIEPRIRGKQHEQIVRVDQDIERWLDQAELSRDRFNAIAKEKSPIKRLRDLEEAIFQGHSFTPEKHVVAGIYGFGRRIPIKVSTIPAALNRAIEEKNRIVSQLRNQVSTFSDTFEAVDKSDSFFSEIENIRTANKGEEKDRKVTLEKGTESLNMENLRAFLENALKGIDTSAGGGGATTNAWDDMVTSWNNYGGDFISFMDEPSTIAGENWGAAFTKALGANGQKFREHISGKNGFLSSFIKTIFEALVPFWIDKNGEEFAKSLKK